MFVWYTLGNILRLDLPIQRSKDDKVKSFNVGEHMFINEIKEIKNYRNLSGITILLDPEINFLIGENNLGKTNFLELIHQFFSVGKFQEDDFENKETSIEVTMVIKYSDAEIGFFEDNFDIEDCHSITIKGIQESIDDRIEYFYGPSSDQKLNSTIVKKINTLYYYAQRMPSKEVDFRKNKGSGKVLNYLIQSSLKGLSIEEKDLLLSSGLENVVDNINVSLSKINTITGDAIQAYVDNNPAQILCRMLGIGDSNRRDLSKLGEGIQYAFNILLQIIESIYSVKTSRKSDKFEERLVSVDGNKLFPIILILDEPEIHQHPYRQRSLIKKLTSLMNNQNDDFTALLKDLFGIDGLTGQIFLATHSPNILLNEYCQFVRIYQKSSKLEFVSGKSITFDEDPKLFKHLLHNFIYLKEALLSRYVVFVEGDTEMGAIPVFAERLNIDLDSNGIGIIKLDGADGVKRCMALYDKFGIPSIAIIDEDKRNLYSDVPNVYFTTEKDYEEDVYSNFELSDYLKCCKELGTIAGFIGVLNKRGYSVNAQEFMENPDYIKINTDEQQLIMEEQKEQQLKSLKNSKNAQKGLILAKFVTTIPDAFENALKKIVGEIE